MCCCCQVDILSCCVWQCRTCGLEEAVADLKVIREEGTKAAADVNSLQRNVAELQEARDKLRGWQTPHHTSFNSFSALLVRPG